LLDEIQQAPNQLARIVVLDSVQVQVFKHRNASLHATGQTEKGMHYPKFLR
jgi:hypothetical protein